MDKLTIKRQKVLNIVAKSSNHLSALEIADYLKKDKINLSTIYRSLEYLFSQGLIGKTYKDNIGYYYIEDHKHHHYLICNACNQEFEIDCKLDQLIENIQKNYHFKVLHHDITLTGLCDSCQNKIK